MTTIADRLKEARLELGLSQKDLARLAGVSAGTIGNIEAGARDEPQKLVEIANAAQVTPGWLKLGKGAKRPPGWTPEQHPSEGVGAHPVAHDLSLHRRDDAPVRIEWDRILKDPLKREFQTTMPDASMEPDIPRGAGIIFVTDLQAAPGDWVLIKDRDGNPFVRELRQVKPGRWQAHALNPAFLPMDSDADGLQVLAVFDGLRGRKARV